MIPATCGRRRRPVSSRRARPRSGRCGSGCRSPPDGAASPRCRWRAAKQSRARASAVSGSIMIRPVSPAMKVTLEMSSPACLPARRAPLRQRGCRSAAPAPQARVLLSGLGECAAAMGRGERRRQAHHMMTAVGCCRRGNPRVARSKSSGCMPNWRGALARCVCWLRGLGRGRHRRQRSARFRARRVWAIMGPSAMIAHTV